MDKEQYALMRRLEDTHWWYQGMRGITAALASRYISTDRKAQLLDAGCGTGGFLAAYDGLGVGIDYSPDALDFCRQRGLTRLARASVESLPLRDGSFDLLVSSDVLYHLGVSSDVQALREFHRVLRPGGLAVIRVPAYDWLRGAHDIAVHTRHRYTGYELRDKLKEAGFKVVRTTHANSLLFPVALLKRLLEGRLTGSSSELGEASPLVNRIGRLALGLESRILSTFDLPWGLSVIGVGLKT